MTFKHKRLTIVMAILIAIVPACALGTDTEPASLPVPEDVFPPSAQEKESLTLSAETTFHPVYFFKEDQLARIQRPLPAPVFLDAPLNNLLEGPSEREAELGMVSAIPAGTAIVDVALNRNNTISIHLNQTFFEIEGEQRIKASAQLVMTASDLIRNTQGVVFFLENKPVQLPDGNGLIEEVAEGRLPTPLTIRDYATLTPGDLFD